jgi:hypothetical protein
MSLQTVLDNYVSILEDISANPKPSYQVGDRAVSWNEYQKMLLDLIKGLNEQINALSPFELRTIHY